MRKVIRFAGIIVALLLLAVLILPFVIKADDFRPRLESELSKALGREVKVGSLKLAILSGGVTADDLSVGDDPAFSPTPFVQAKSITLGVDLWTLIFSRKLHVTGLTIDQPQVTLLQSPAGEWNFSSLSQKSAPAAQTAPEPPAAGGSGLDLSVKLVKITNGRFSLGRTGRQHWTPLVLEKVNAELRDFSPANVCPFSLGTTVAGGGAIKLDGKAGPLNPADAAMTPVSASLTVTGLDLAASGLHEYAPSVAGMISFDGSGESTGDIVNLKGHLKAENLKLARNGTAARRPVEFEFAAEHNMKKHAGVLRRGDIHIGSAPSSLTGTYGERGEAMLVAMNLSGPNMPLQELEGMLPAMGIELPHGSSLQGGTASVKLAMEGPLDRLVTSGTVSLNKTRLAGFDLPSRLSTIERLAGIQGGPDTEIEIFATKVRMAPEGLSADEIQFIAPAVGELNGSGTVSPANALDFKMRATVHTGGVMAVISNTPIPFLVQGTCAQPTFHPDLKAVVKEEVQNVESDVKKAAGNLLKGLLGGKKD